MSRPELPNLMQSPCAAATMYANGAKPKLLYIASNGRSGSTILEMLLNLSPHLWTLGEFHVLPWELRENVKPCGCGTAVSECEFWGPIVSEHRATLVNGTIDRFRRAYNVDRTLRFRELPALLKGNLRESNKQMIDVARYARDNSIVLNAAMQSARSMNRPELSRLVDASKSPYRLLWLAASEQLDLKVIHLVKDPRSFAFSSAKGSSGARLAYRVARAALRWRVENALLESVCDNYLSPSNVQRLKYEQLAGNAQETLRRLADWLGIPPWTADQTCFRTGNHGISGNPSRFESRPLALDERWKRELPSPLQRLAFRCASSRATRYGYTAC